VGSLISGSVRRRSIGQLHSDGAIHGRRKRERGFQAHYTWMAFLLSACIENEDPNIW
jgi:hypothetical protein